MDEWLVETIERLVIRRQNRLADMYLLSPFVWRDDDRFRLLLRAVPRRDDEPRLKMAEIWHGESADGLTFEMDEAPLIWPGPDLADLDGCEDPTVRFDDGILRIWYTGYNERERTGRMLLARGPDVPGTRKAGPVIDSVPPFANPKEATVVASGGGWRIFFEYAHDGASLIGQADAKMLDGPWSRPERSALQPRPDHWDAWHLSPGPIIAEGSDTPIMFYNGATQDAQWRVGWARFDADLTTVIARSEQPLLRPDGDLVDGATDIAFVASAVEEGDRTWLYLSQSDQDLRRATVRRA